MCASLFLFVWQFVHFLVNPIPSFLVFYPPITRNQTTSGMNVQSLSFSIKDLTKDAIEVCILHNIILRKNYILKNPKLMCGTKGWYIESTEYETDKPGVYYKFLKSITFGNIRDICFLGFFLFDKNFIFLIMNIDLQLWNNSTFIIYIKSMKQ